MGYEGYTCSFTCNTGYELTGSDTRTCQSNGSWSGNNTACRGGNNLYVSPAKFYINFFIVTCPSFVHPTNGVVNCSLGDDRVLSYKDTCNFTCDIGYELTGSDTRTCQSNRSWSGSDTECERGNNIVQRVDQRLLLQYFQCCMLF